jgi:hypothetical protein
MRSKLGLGGSLIGGLVGLVLGWYLFGQQRTAEAATDRYEDFALTTSTINAGQVNLYYDGLWMLDYKSGKLRCTVVNRNTGRLSSWAEVDLVSEFGLQPRTNVHFLMASGIMGRGTSALYLVETTSGKVGVYTMTLNPEFGRTEPGVLVRRMDMSNFRTPKDEKEKEKTDAAAAK